MDILEQIKQDFLNNGIKNLSEAEFNQKIKEYNLTEEEEKELNLWAFENDIYSIDDNLDNIGSYVNGYLRLSADEEKELSKIIRHSQDENQIKAAKEKFINGNIGLVYVIAKKYVDKNKGMFIDDLVQEGTFGLIKAVDKFEYDKGFKFSTYASYWIKDAILKGKENGHVRIPVHVLNEISKLKKIKEKYLAENFTEISQQELQDITGYPPEKLFQLQQYMEMQSSFSMNQESSDEDKTEIINLVEDKNNSDMGGDLITSMSMEYYQSEFKRMLDEFTDRQKSIFLSIFIDGMSYEDVAKKEGISSSRVRQIATMVQSKMARKISEDEEFQALMEDIIK